MLDWLNSKLSIPLRVGLNRRSRVLPRDQPTEAACEREARLPILTENMSDVIVRYGADGERLYVSPSIRRYGYEPEEFVGGIGLRYVHPDDLPKVEQVANRIRQGWRPPPDTAVESRLRTKSGDWVWLEGKPNPIYDAGGRLLEVVWILRDIDARKTAEAALIQSEARYRMLADNVTDLILHQDADFRVLYASPSARQFGFDPDVLLGQRSIDYVHPDDWEKTLARRRAALTGGRTKSSEIRVRMSGGDWLWVESTLVAVRDEAGDVTGFVTTLRDITERKVAELAPVESELRYRLLAENSMDVIVQFNAEGRIQYTSPSVGQWGYSVEDFVGQQTGAFAHPDDLALLTERRAALRRGETLSPIEVRMKRADGGWAWVETNPAVLRGEASQILGVVVMLRDVTARRAAEAAMQAINAELTRVVRISTLGAFAASIAHEVNQPLAAAAIDGEASMRWLAREPPNLERAVRAIQRANDNVRRASAVVGRLRSMVVREKPNRIEFDLNDAVREVLSLTTRGSQSSGIVIQPTLTAAPMTVVGDRIQFQQVILNLVGNAIDAVREAPLDDRLILVRSALTGSGYAEILVEDRGAGVPPEKVGQIFDTLFTTKLGGTGLGLPISRAIVDAHGGQLWVEHAQPRGAIFKLRLPTPAAAGPPGRYSARTQP